MKKNLLWISLFLLFCFFTCFPNKVEAMVCTSKNYNNVKKEAGDVKISYELHHSKGTTPYYQVTVSNLTQNLVFGFNGERYTYGYNKEDPAVVTLADQIDVGTTFSIKLEISDANACYGHDLKTISTKLPYFNRFYDYDECLAYPEFYMCSISYDTEDITETQFLDALQKYIDSLPQKGEPEEEKPSIFEQIWNFIVENWQMVSIVTAVTVVVVLIILYIRKKRRVRIAGLE